MSRRILTYILCIAFLFTVSTTMVGEDRDPSPRDLKGVSKSHRYLWAVAGGTVLGAGIGVIAPGGGKSVAKGALLGGSITSAVYLAKNRRAAHEHRDWAHIVTNTALGTGLFWTICDCGDGAWSGALIGGGGTALFQAFGTHNRNVRSMTGSSIQPGTSPQNIPSHSGDSSQSQSTTSAQSQNSGKPKSLSKNTQKIAAPSGPEKSQQEAQQQ